MKTLTLVPCLVAALFGCGPRDSIRRHEPASLLAPPPPPASSAAETAAPPPPGPPPAPPPKEPRGKFISLALDAKSGKVDKVGSKDGAFTPDGINDLVLDAEIEGPAIAFIVATTDADGKSNGGFTADTFVGTQLPPSEPGAEIKPGMGTAGVGVYENGKLANAPDGSITPLPAGRHELTLYVSSRELQRKGSVRAYAVFDDRSLVPGPVVTTK